MSAMLGNARLSRDGRLVAVVTGCLLFSIIVLLSARPYLPGPVQANIPHLPQQQSPRPWVERPIGNDEIEAVCRGPRGGRINEAGNEDVAQAVSRLPSAGGVEAEGYPVPTYGSYEDIGLGKTWMSFAARYGPYGYREDELNYNWSRLDWNSVNWGQLQDQCLLSRSDRSTEHTFLQSVAAPKFRFLHETTGTDEPSKEVTGRHAIVLRTWSTYDYQPEDFWNLRSIITEASLATQGEFTVFLLVDVKDKDVSKIHEDDSYYRQILEASVPPEFRDMTVLYHESLQKSWYAKVNEYAPFWQIMQPLQLFAHFYRDFDTYWQVEMDTRFTGHVGEIARAFHTFGQDQPYKQARERSSWTFIPRLHGSYANFSSNIDAALKGGATVWGSLANDAWGWKPLATQPPTSDPEDDGFVFGIGQSADLLLFSPVSDILRIQSEADWPFINWHKGVGSSAPRFLSFPAQAWASRNLLEAIHHDQHTLGLRVHSEATLPTFALWHGFKVVQVPMPKFQYPERPLEELDAIYNGGPPSSFKDGVANGPAPYRSGAIKFFARQRTFEWQSSLIKPIWEWWVHGSGRETSGDDEGESESDELDTGLGRLVKRARSNQAPIPDVMPDWMREVDGQVYMPPFMMHPRKTNKNL